MTTQKLSFLSSLSHPKNNLIKPDEEQDKIKELINPQEKSPLKQRLNETSLSQIIRTENSDSFYKRGSKEDKELLEILIPSNNPTRKTSLRTKEYNNSKHKQENAYLHLKGKENIDDYNVNQKNREPKKCNSDFFLRMQHFMDRKNQKIEEQINFEKSLHSPTLTFKGYMKTPKKIENMIVEPLIRKRERLEKIKLEMERKEMAEVTGQPKINNEKVKDSKLGIHMPMHDYVEKLRKRQISINEQMKKRQTEKETNEMKECSHKPLINKKVVNGNLMTSSNNRSEKTTSRSYSSLKSVRTVKTESTHKDSHLSLFDIKMNNLKNEIRSLLLS